jgi:hypothetical protein
VLVAVASISVSGAVDDDAKDVGLECVQDFARPFGRGTPVLAQTQGEEYAVGTRNHHGRIGHRHQRRRVNDDVFELLAQIGQDFLEVRLAQQFRRVRRPGTAGQQRQAVNYASTGSSPAPFGSTLPLS